MRGAGIRKRVPASLRCGPAWPVQALLNDYAECVVTAVQAQGGQVLKSIGDGILAIFVLAGTGSTLRSSDRRSTKPPGSAP